ncbi:Kunitz/Bovine pancreatic trypsin inhibitor domain protein [Ancylostoma caninum]|uniref:Kunitz/Bovine pancreatic trypsin inhibitor domain protein n=1 Tax=Ancylostoma caninum TaxID=29170 RepID=A0A368FIQ5_ANCCA|nr:Kunitz/Bovine pancreatic trypsin inhibitor domain protein [Ancylostoma caninum]
MRDLSFLLLCILAGMLVVNAARPRNATCFLPVRRGRCRASIERWAYNAETNRCHIFSYGGCDGNENNFPDKHSCRRACRRRYLDNLDNRTQAGAVEQTVGYDQ